MKFRDLEKDSAVTWLEEGNPSSLTEWYLSVRDIHLDRLGVGDVCRALRQDLFVSDILPVAIALLNEDILAGERYDGELVAALADLHPKYWQDNTSAAHQAARALTAVEHLCNDPEFLSDASTLTQKLAEAGKL